MSRDNGGGCTRGPPAARGCTSGAIVKRWDVVRARIVPYRANRGDGRCCSEAASERRGLD